MMSNISVPMPPFFFLSPASMRSATVMKTTRPLPSVQSRIADASASSHPPAVGDRLVGATLFAEVAKPPRRPEFSCVVADRRGAVCDGTFVPSLLIITVWWPAHDLALRMRGPPVCPRLPRISFTIRRRRPKHAAGAFARHR